MKRKVKIERIIILLLIVLALIALLIFAASKLLSFKKDPVPNNTNNNNNEINNIVDNNNDETNDEIKLTLLDYEIYIDDTSNLGFNFIIAKVKFESKDPVKFNFNNLQTSEKIYLDDINKYLNKISLEGVSLSSFNLINGINSKENEIEGNIFIPFTTDSYSLAVYNNVDASKLEFDLLANNKNVTSLKLSTGDDIIIGNTNIFVSNSYISTFMKHNDEEYQIGSSMRIYTFEITVKEIESDVMITDAIFIEEGTNNEIHCMAKEYNAIDAKNILETKLEFGSKGALFFEAFSNSETAPKGTLLLKFSNEEDWIKIDA